MRFFQFALRHSTAILFTVAVAALSGVALLQNMPVSLFPDITFPRIVILADNGEQPVERMMVEVTKPLEEAASSVPGVRLVRSITSRGSSEISVNLAWGGDVTQTMQLIQGRVADIRGSLPPGASVQTEQMQVSVFPILGYSLTSDTLDQVALRDIALYQIRPALVRVPGVARVEVTGGETREFVVTVSPEKLAVLGLDVGRVADAIRSSNILESAGLVEDNRRLYLSIVTGQFAGIGDIENCVVAMRNGAPIRVRDVADVSPSVQDRMIRTTARGREAVLVNVMRQPTGSTVRIGEDVVRALSTLRLPAGVHFENFYDQGAFIDSSIRSTRDSIIVGILLSMVVLWVFLRNPRMTLIMAIIVPATIAVTIVCLVAVGRTINIMTLGGIAAAVGLIIDDSIVVMENVFTQFRSSPSSDVSRTGIASVAGSSLRSLMPAIGGSTASTIVIHIPLAFLGGVTGAFFASLSVTMVFALVISFVLSITLAPVLAVKFLRARDIERELALHERESRIARWYRRTLSRMLRLHHIILPAAVAIGALTWFLFDHIGSDFMPDMDEGSFVLDYKTPPGSSFTETDRMLRKVETLLMEIPEVESYSRRTGTQMGFFVTEPNDGDFLVKLKNARSRDIHAVISEVRNRINASEPTLQIEFGQLMMDVIGDLTNNPSPVEVKVFGANPDVLHQKARDIAALMERVPGVVDVFDGIVISGPSLVFTIDASKAAQAGFTTEDVRTELEAVIHGSADKGMLRGEKMVAVRVRYPRAYHLDIDRIRQLRIVNPAGGSARIGDIADIDLTEGRAEIHREGLLPFVGVTARIEGRDLGGTIADIKNKIRRELALPEGVSLEYGGVYQSQQESFRGLINVLLAALALVFIVLLFEFGEFAIPVAIMIIDLLSLLGVFAALWITGMTFNISSLVGIIMVVGIVAENAIFVMHNVKRMQARGAALNDALVEATRLRARPIIMTTLAALFALLPLSLGFGAGAQMQQPLAIAVMGGFSVSSLLLFFGLPLVYRLMKRSGNQATGNRQQATVPPQGR